MFRAALLSGLASIAFFHPASAQSASGEGGFDFDTLAACSVVYLRIGDIYAEQENPTEAQSFAATATAYAASAYHVLQYLGYDQATAYPYSQERMAQIVDSLNRSAQTDPDGEMGVIEDWLGYCDTLGAGVEELLSRREQAGW